MDVVDLGLGGEEGEVAVEADDGDLEVGRQEGEGGGFRR